MFPIGRNERYFVAIWTLIRNRIRHHPSDEQRDRIRTTGASLVRYARPLHRGLLASWVPERNGLIPLTRWRPLCGFPDAIVVLCLKLISRFRSSCKFFVRLKSYDWLELAMRSMVCECRLYVSCSARSSPLASLDNKVNADFSTSRRPSNDRVGPNGKRHLPGD